MIWLWAIVAVIQDVSATCAFCLPGEMGGGSFDYDFTALPRGPFELRDTFNNTYYVVPPCAVLADMEAICPPHTPLPMAGPAVQIGGGRCLALGEVADNGTVPINLTDHGGGVAVTIRHGSTYSCDLPRELTYKFVCDRSVPMSNPPNQVVEARAGSCAYSLTWRSPLACAALAPQGHCAASVPVPTAAQLLYQSHEIVGLTHFNMATFVRDGDPACNAANWNVGVHSSHPATFNPVNLNVSNWVESYRALGVKHTVLTAKHGCGFLLWNTSTTLPTGQPYAFGVQRTAPSFKRNVLREYVDVLTHAGIGHGFYYSTGNNFYLGRIDFKQVKYLPGMANVTDEQFNALVLQHVTELWSEYGDLTEIWFDHGYSTSQKPQLSALLHKYQANAAGFGGLGLMPSPVKWVGTESGLPSYPIWATGCSTTGDPSSTLYCPTGADTTLQEGDHWFYVPGEPIRSLKELIDVYHHTVGANAVLEMDFAIDRTGNIDTAHAKRYEELGSWVRACYGAPVASTKVNGTSVELKLPSDTHVDRVMLQEYVEYGERVRSWRVEAKVSGRYVPFLNGTVVGWKRIALAKAPVRATHLRLTIPSGVAMPLVKTFAAFRPEACPVVVSP